MNNIFLHSRGREMFLCLLFSGQNMFICRHAVTARSVSKKYIVFKRNLEKKICCVIMHFFVKKSVQCFFFFFFTVFSSKYFLRTSTLS